MMQRYARVQGGTVLEIIEIEEGAAPLEERFHPDVLAQMHPAGGAVMPGWLLVGEAFEAPTTPTMTEAEARQMRDARLRASDWTQLADAPLAAEQVAAWAAYRAALRAVPAQPGFPAVITWPAAPGA
jgi:hypothetical protein